jgi:hypothetical protein
MRLCDKRKLARVQLATGFSKQSLTTCCAGAHGTVGGRSGRAAAVSDFGIKEAFPVSEILAVEVLDAPEAAGCYGCGL